MLTSMLAIAAPDVVIEDRFRVHTLDDLALRSPVHYPTKALVQKVNYSVTDGNSVRHGKFTPQGNDQGSTMHDYFIPYERAFIGLPRNLTMLNIGILGGHSLRTYATFFGPKAKVVGCDVNLGMWHHSLQDQPQPPNVELFEGSSMARETADALQKLYGQFELIVDDGCHEVDCIEKTFHNLFPLLRPGGLYIMEDSAPLPLALRFVKEIQAKTRDQATKRHDERLRKAEARVAASAAARESHQNLVPAPQVESVSFGSGWMMVNKYQPGHARAAG